MICIAKLLLCSSLAPRALLPYGTDRLLPEAEVLETINVNGK